MQIIKMAQNMLLFVIEIEKENKLNPELNK